MTSEAAQKAYPERVLPLYPEPPIGTWARDRFGGITYRQENGGWGQPGVMPFGKWEAMYDARGPYVETGPWGEPLEGGAMSTRDEWARMNPSDYSSKSSAYAGGYQAGRDALIAEGWRKKPSRDELADAIGGEYGYRWEQIPPMTREAYLMIADAILALMDRGQ